IVHVAARDVPSGPPSHGGPLHLCASRDLHLRPNQAASSDQQRSSPTSRAEMDVAAEIGAGLRGARPRRDPRFDFVRAPTGRAIRDTNAGRKVTAPLEVVDT